MSRHNCVHEEEEEEESKTFTVSSHDAFILLLAVTIIMTGKTKHVSCRRNKYKSHYSRWLPFFAQRLVTAGGVYRVVHVRNTHSEACVCILK